MKYRTLGRTGIDVSPYCLGTMMFGAMGNPDHDDSARIIHMALDALCVDARPPSDPPPEQTAPTTECRPRPLVGHRP